MSLLLPCLLAPFLGRMAASKDDPAAIAVVTKRAIAEHMTEGGVVGVSVGIYHDGHRYFFNAGTLRSGQPMPPSNRTRYAIASITKTFTGTLLAQAAVEKRLRLDDDVRNYLPGSYPNLEVGGTPVRIWQLVNHDSGIPNFLPGQAPLWTLLDSEADSVRNYTRDDFLRDLHAVTLAYRPGTKFSYSNSAAQLAGLVLERVYGKRYEVLLYTKITTPLGMRSTKISLSTAERAALPAAYSGNLASAPTFSEVLPEAGSITSDAEDMLKYIAWNIAESAPAALLAHQTPARENENGFYHGLNWQILHREGVRKLFQYGNVPGFHSACVIYPELKLGIIVLTNGQASANPPSLDPLVNSVLGSFDSRATLMP